MNLDRVIAVRTNETVYRDGMQCVTVFGDGFLFLSYLKNMGLTDILREVFRFFRI